MATKFPVYLEKDDQTRVAYSEADVVRFEFDGFRRVRQEEAENKSDSTKASTAKATK